MSATCIFGSDLWPYRGIEALVGATPMGHEHCGTVEEVGSGVSTLEPGQFVVAPSGPATTPSTSAKPATRAPFCSGSAWAPFGTQAEYERIPLADGPLVATPEVPSPDLVPHYLAASDALGTGWFAAVGVEVGPGKTVVVVGDGAVGLLGILAAHQLRAERIAQRKRRRSGNEAGPPSR